MNRPSFLRLLVAAAAIVPAAHAADLPPWPQHGAWQGTAQFRFLSGAPLDARADDAIALEVRPDGRLRGGSSSTGCKLEGIHTRERSRDAVLVDIEVSGCRDVRFNARYSGRLETPSPGTSRLRLQAITAGRPANTPDGMLDLSLATIDASLRR